MQWLLHNWRWGFMLVSGSDYLDLLDQVQDEITTTRADAGLVAMHWRIGCWLNEERECGACFIGSWSKSIRAAFPGIKGMSGRNVRHMATFAREASSELCSDYCKNPWGYIMKLLDKTEPGARREWYRQAIVESGWSQTVLDHQLDMHPYKRQALSGNVSYFSRTLLDPQSELAQMCCRVISPSTMALREGMT